MARTTRHGQPQVNTPHSRRRVSLSDFEWADLIDDLDSRMLVDPTSSYAKAAAAAMNRTIDDQIIAALGGSLILALLVELRWLYQAHLNSQLHNKQTD